MKLLSIVFILITTIVLCSCSSNDCSEDLSKNHPQIKTYIEELELADYMEVSCNSETHDNYSFHGYQEPGGKCSHFEVKLDVGKTTITTYTFKNKEDKRLYDFIVYSFVSDEDLKKMQNFVPDASLYLEKNKEIHEYFIEKDQVILYYYGFP
ncbi:MAG: hypothetical protein H6599_07620 [Flavobacteriales bacterium]|nr:hypothetical protein [Flavobacteriales bacterium]